MSSEILSLIQIEKEAEQRIEKAKREAEQRINAAQAKAEEMVRKAEMNDVFFKLREKREAEIKEKVKKIEEQFKKEKERFKELAEKNFEKAVGYIVNSVLGELK